MNAQVVLIIAGLALIATAIIGSGNYVKVVIPSLPAWARVLFGIMGIGVFALAFIPGIANNSPGAAGQSADPKAPSPSHASTAEPSLPLPSPGAEISATLRYPTDGTKVSKSQGFIATGTATALGSYTVWILDYDGGYFVDQEAKVVAGRWSAADEPLGDSSNHLPFDLTFRAVVAKPACAARLRRINASSNDFTARLPGGCKIIGEATVNVVRP
jgi:hypothetical protein